MFTKNNTSTYFQVDKLPKVLEYVPMSYENITFTPTPQVRRLLKVMLSYWENHDVSIPVTKLLFIEPVATEEFHAESKNVQEFMKWLDKECTFDNISSWLEIQSLLGHSQKTAPAHLLNHTMRILDVGPVRFLQKELFNDDDNQTDLNEKDDDIVRFVESSMKIFVNGDERHHFQNKQRGNFPRMGSIFNVLWKYRLHTTKHGVIGKNEKLTLTQIESKLAKEKSSYLKPSFITDMQSFLSKLQDKNIAIGLKVENPKNGATLVQLVVDEHSV